MARERVSYLFTEVHRLCGTAKTCGLTQLGALATDAEDALLALQNAPGVGTSAVAGTAIDKLGASRSGDPRDDASQ